MKRAKVVLVAAFAVPLAGCVLTGKPKQAAVVPGPPKVDAPAPPAEPLSIPQTQVQLPPPQPVNPDALNTAPPESHARQAPAKPATTPKPQRTPPAPQPKPPENTTPVEQPPAEPTRAPVQEIMDEKERVRLRDDAHVHQSETRRLLGEARPGNANQRRTASEIRQFLKQSVDAEAAGDMRIADELAERAHILAKELQSGK